MKISSKQLINIIDGTDEQFEFIGTNLKGVEEQPSSPLYTWNYEIGFRTKGKFDFQLVEAAFSCMLNSERWNEYGKQNLVDNNAEYESVDCFIGNQSILVPKSKPKERMDHYCTVGDLLNFIDKNRLPLDAKIVMQRVEDHYFNEVGGWKENLVRMPGEFYHQELKRNQNIIDGVYDDKEQYPNYPEEMKKLVTTEELDALKEEYYHCSPVFFKEKPNILFLAAHY